MSTIYYVAFMVGFAATALSQVDKVANNFANYQAQVRNIEKAPPLPTPCDFSLSKNFCNPTK